MSTEPMDAWDDWFDDQSPLCRRIDKAIAALSKDRNDDYRAALYSAVIESAAERLRMYLVPLPPRPTKDQS